MRLWSSVDFTWEVEGICARAITDTAIQKEEMKIQESRNVGHRDCGRKKGALVSERLLEVGWRTSVLLGGDLHVDEGADAESDDDQKGDDAGEGSSQSAGGNFSEGAGGGVRYFGDWGEEVGSGEYSFTCVGAKGSDHLRSDCGCAVPKGVSNVGEDGSGVLIGLREDDIQDGHHGTVVGVAFHLDGASESTELNIDKVFGGAVDPL